MIGGTTLFHYLFTTALATTIGLVFASLFQPHFPVLSTSNLSYEPAEAPSVMDTIVGIFSSSFLTPITESNMLQVIVMALILGFAIILLGEKGKPAVRAVNLCNDIFMKAMEMILRLSPIGVFCLLCPVIAENGPQILGSLAMVLLCAYLAYLVHMLLVCSLSVRALGGLYPRKFFKGMLPAMLFAFSSASTGSLTWAAPRSTSPAMRAAPSSSPACRGGARRRRRGSRTVFCLHRSASGSDILHKRNLLPPVPGVKISLSELRWSCQVCPMSTIW